jgi:hypothetical protein
MPQKTLLPKVRVQVLDTPNGEYSILEITNFTPVHNTLGALNKYSAQREYNVYDGQDDYVGTFTNMEAALAEIGYTS